MPLPFTGGVINNFLMTYAAGGTLVLEPGFVPDRVIELLESERITTLFATLAALALAEAQRTDQLRTAAHVHGSGVWGR